MAEFEGRTGPIEVPEDASLVEPHYSTKGITPFIKWLDQEEGTEIIDAVLADAGLSRAYISSNDLWVSTTWQLRFQRSLAARLYQQPDLPEHQHEMWQLWRKAAWATLANDQNTALMTVLRALLSPGFAMEQLPALITSYNATLQAEVDSIQSCVAEANAYPEVP